MNSSPTTLAMRAALPDNQTLASATTRVRPAIERTSLATLALKLAAGFALPALVLVAVGVVIWITSGTLQAWPEGATRAALERWLYVAIALVVVGVVACAGAFLALRHLLVRPIRHIDALLARMSSADGELSHHLEAMSNDELGNVAVHFNDFVNKLRALVNDVRKQCLTVAFGSAAMNGRIFDSAAICRRQQAETERIFELSTAATQAMSEVAENASQIALASEERTVVAEKAYAELLAVTAKVRGVGDSIAAFTGTVGELDANSRSIGEIVKLINDISDQTNLLALNAAIEAARAGEVGRGFAVVADEVRKLAEKVRKATDVISESISNMTTLVTSTQRESQAISKDIEHTREVVERSSHHFETMVASFTQMRAQVDAIGGAISGLEGTNKAIHESASGIRQLTGHVADDMQESTSSAQELTSATERIAEIVAQFRTGSGRFEAVIETTRRYRDQVAAAIEALAQSGTDVFDANYRPVPGTSPQKYRTTYDAQCERALQPLYDQLVADVPGGVFAVAVDVNAYAPTHNSKYSQPLTGDAQRDRVHSRDKRIFDDATGLRAAKNSRPMLLQTYRRDTGELLGDLSMPIHVRGRHWGALRLGCKLDALAG